MSRVRNLLKVLLEHDYNLCNGNHVRDELVKTIESAAILDEKERDNNTQLTTGGMTAVHICCSNCRHSLMISGRVTCNKNHNKPMCCNHEFWELNPDWIGQEEEKEKHTLYVQPPSAGCQRMPAHTFETASAVGSMAN